LNHPYDDPDVHFIRINELKRDSCESGNHRMQYGPWDHPQQIDCCLFSKHFPFLRVVQSLLDSSVTYEILAVDNRVIHATVVNDNGEVLMTAAPTYSLAPYHHISQSAQTVMKSDIDMKEGQSLEEVHSDDTLYPVEMVIDQITKKLVVRKTVLPPAPKLPVPLIEKTRSELENELQQAVVSIQVYKRQIVRLTNEVERLNELLESHQ